MLTDDMKATITDSIIGDLSDSYAKAVEDYLDTLSLDNQLTLIAVLTNRRAGDVIGRGFSYLYQRGALHMTEALDKELENAKARTTGERRTQPNQGDQSAGKPDSEGGPAVDGSSQR